MRTRVFSLLILVISLCVPNEGAAAREIAPGDAGGGPAAAPEIGSSLPRPGRLLQAPAQARPSRPGDRDVVFSGTTTTDGAIVVEGRGGDLAFSKKVHQDGSFTLDIEAPHDKVTVGFSAHAVTIRRGRKSVTLAIGEGREEDLDKARRLVADSRAVRLLRTAAAAAVDRGDDGAASVALVAGDALVGFLSGDIGAPGRAAKHIARRGRGRVRTVSQQQDCYRLWEQNVVIASYDWEACANDFSVWNPIRNLCALRWLIQVESYWFSFIACSGLGSIL
jgi:hypothetical protein